MEDGEGRSPTVSYRMQAGDGTAMAARAPRRPTVLGVAPGRDDRTMDDRARAIDRMAAPYRDKRAFLSPRTRELEGHVAAGLKAARQTCSRVNVISVAQYRRTFYALPPAVREEAFAGLRTGIEKGVVTPLERLLHDASGYLPVAADRAMVPTIRLIADKAEAWFAENLSDIVPKARTDAFRATIGFHAMAIASGDLWRLEGIRPFAELWRAGHVPVGLLTDRSFLVITE